MFTGNANDADPPSWGVPAVPWITVSDLMCADSRGLPSSGSLYIIIRFVFACVCFSMCFLFFSVVSFYFSFYIHITFVSFFFRSSWCVLGSRTVYRSRVSFLSSECIAVYISWNFRYSLHRLCFSYRKTVVDLFWLPKEIYAIYSVDDT